MPLPNSYVQTGRIKNYFEAMLDADPPSRFSINFLENLGFKSTNDRAVIGVLKELGFIDSDGKPLPRYFQFLDKTQWKRIVADGIRQSYSDLFAINKNAQDLSLEQVQSKLRTLYAGQKGDSIIGLIAKTFVELCKIADFSSGSQAEADSSTDQNNDDNIEGASAPSQGYSRKVTVDSLQYHINIVLPESRDQAVYDAIFRSLREHLG